MHTRWTHANRPSFLVTFIRGQRFLVLYYMRVTVYDTTKGSASWVIAPRIYVDDSHTCYSLYLILERSFKCLDFYWLYAVATCYMALGLRVYIRFLVGTCCFSLSGRLPLINETTRRAERTKRIRYTYIRVKFQSLLWATHRIHCRFISEIILG